MCVIVYRILVPRNPWSFFPHMQYKPVRQQTHMDKHMKNTTQGGVVAHRHMDHILRLSQPPRVKISTVASTKNIPSAFTRPPSPSGLRGESQSGSGAPPSFSAADGATSAAPSGSGDGSVMNATCLKLCAICCLWTPPGTTWNPWLASSTSAPVSAAQVIGTVLRDLRDTHKLTKCNPRPHTARARCVAAGCIS